LNVFKKICLRKVCYQDEQNRYFFPFDFLIWLTLLPSEEEKNLFIDEIHKHNDWVKE
jgi:hypothetical protein